MTDFELKVQQTLHKVSTDLDQKVLEVSNASLPDFSKVKTCNKLDYIPTGFQELDRGLGGGLIRGKAYLMASFMKAGKSSYLRKMIFQMASLGAKIAVIDVEQDEEFALRQLTSIAKGKYRTDVTEEDMEGVKNFLAPNLVYMTRNNTGILADETDAIKIEKCEAALTKAVKERGCNVCIFDNVTPIASEGSGSSADDRMRMMSALVRLSKKQNVAVIVVGHVNDETQNLMSEDKIREIIDKGTPEKIIDDTIITIKRPTIKNVYGGSIKTQFDCTFLLWRPYQNYAEEKFNKIAWLLVEENRYGPSFKIRLKFDGARSDFSEVPAVVESFSLPSVDLGQMNLAQDYNQIFNGDL